MEVYEPPKLRAPTKEAEYGEAIKKTLKGCGGNPTDGTANNVR